MKIFLIEVPDLITIVPHRRKLAEKQVATAQRIKDALSWRDDYDDPELGFEEKGKIVVTELQEKPKHFKRAVTSE